MDLESDYAAAVYQDLWTVTGRLLRPLTLGSALLLRRVGSPFAELPPKRDARLGDLALAVWICERGWPEARDGMRGRRCALALAWRGWVWGRRDWFLQRARFLAYLSHAWTGPRMWVKEEAASSGAPLLQTLILHRVMHLHQSLTAALEVPVKLALWDKAAWSEGSGILSFVSPEVASLLDEQARESRAESLADGQPQPGDGQQRDGQAKPWQEHGAKQPQPDGRQTDRAAEQNPDAGSKHVGTVAG